MVKRKKKEKRKKEKRNENQKKKTLPFFSFDKKIKRKFLGIIFLLLAITFIFSFFGKAGKIGGILLDSFSFLIGKTVFLLPFLLVLSGFSLLLSKYKNIYKAVVISLLLSIISVSGILELLREKEIPILRGLADEGELVGGWGGYFFSMVFMKLVGFWITQIIFLGMLIAGFLIFKNLLKQEPSEKSISLEGKREKPSLVKRIFSPSFKVKKVEKVSETAEKESESLGVKEPAKTSFSSEATKGEIDKRKVQEEYKRPPLNLLKNPKGKASGGDIKENSAVIKKALESFNIPVEMSGVKVGPTVTQYSLKPAEGIKLSKITSLSDDLALALATHPIRIEAPIPGKSLVGIEVPNNVRSFVRLREIFENSEFQESPFDLIFCLGKNVSGSPTYANLERMPHLLVAGATGTGKTIFLNNIIVSLIYRNSPQILKIILVDPKRVEFTVYRKLPHLLCSPIVDSSRVINAFKWLIDEMERRFRLLEEAKSRNISSYNQKIFEEGTEPPLPYIVLVVDELADLMAAKGKEVEASIVRLAQMSRAVGIHLVLATQRPSVEVITGLIKANITSRITFQVASQVDSRTILDSSGAEKLLGLGDMLFLSGETVKPQRIQAPYISEKEVKKIVRWIVDSQTDREKMETEMDMEERIQEALEKEVESSVSESEDDFSEQDPLYQEAKEAVVRYQRGSASLLQRKLRVGYARAARLIDMLEKEGVVGPHRGSKSRKVYISKNGEENDDDSAGEFDEEDGEWKKI